MLTLLDLFCGAGGAARGYQQAGFHVTGVDIRPQPRYIGEQFIQADALQYVAEHGHEYDAIHASPPCQEYSATRHLRDNNAAIKGYQSQIRPKLVGDVRGLLESIGKPWVVENVVGAPMPTAIQLCGTMFGLPLLRHRWFEASFLLFAPGPCQHPEGFYGAVGGKIRGYGTFASGRLYHSAKGPRRREGYPGKHKGIEAMGIDWMTVAEMCEAIPPAYTHFIGLQLMRAAQSLRERE